MMKFSVDLSIYSSPTVAFGNATGEIALPLPPLLGQLIELVDGKQVAITSISTNFEGWTGTSIALEDIVMESEEAAREFAKQLEEELDFFVVPYHDE